MGRTLAIPGAGWCLSARRRRGCGPRVLGPPAHQSLRLLRGRPLQPHLSPILRSKSICMNTAFQTVIARLKPLLAPPHVARGAKLYAASTLVAAIGCGLWLPFSLLYLHLVVGLPLPLVGAGLTGAGIGWLLLAPLVGSLVDRFGARVLFIASCAGVGIGTLPRAGERACHR